MAPLAKPRQISAACSIVSTLVMSEFWGEIQFKFEKGNIVHIRMIRNTKMDDEITKFESVSLSNATIPD